MYANSAAALREHQKRSRRSGWCAAFLAARAHIRACKESREDLKRSGLLNYWQPNNRPIRVVGSFFSAFRSSLSLPSTWCCCTAASRELQHQPFSRRTAVSDSRRESFRHFFLRPLHCRLFLCFVLIRWRYQSFCEKKYEYSFCFLTVIFFLLTFWKLK